MIGIAGISVPVVVDLDGGPTGSSGAMTCQRSWLSKYSTRRGRPSWMFANFRIVQANDNKRCFHKVDSFSTYGVDVVSLDEEIMVAAV